MSDTPERTGVLGWDARKGFSMFRPFWMRTRVVCVFDAGRAGATRVVMEGGMSGVFLVERRMKSYEGRDSCVMLGMVLRTWLLDGLLVGDEIATYQYSASRL
jgi:hypothetical protein